MVRKEQKNNYYIIRLLFSISSNTNDSSLMRLFLSIFFLRTYPINRKTYANIQKKLKSIN